MKEFKTLSTMEENAISAKTQKEKTSLSFGWINDALKHYSFATVC